VAITFELKKGNPYSRILMKMEAQGVDLIVIASHGKTGLQRQLIGSVAETGRKKRKMRRPYKKTQYLINQQK
jgi:nucleotide-binding universal stress UspA family protein